MSRPVSPSPARVDALVIGAGHNGLVCAATLARAGRSVLVLEAADIVGGLSVTREFSPGFRVSPGAHLLNQLPSALIQSLSLAAHGLTFAATHLPTLSLTPDQAPLRIGDRDALGVRSEADARAFETFEPQMQRFARFMQAILQSAPPRLGTRVWSDQAALLKLALKLRLLGRRDMREFLRIIGMNAHDLFNDEFVTDALKGALGFDAILGTNFGPRAPGTVLTYLTRRAAESLAPSTGLAIPTGGMGTVTQALARAAEAAGAIIRCQAPVQRILVEQDRACGVQLVNGECIAASTVISNVDAKTTFLELLGTEHLDTGFVRRVDHYRTRGLSAKLHLALDRRPLFKGVRPDLHGARLLIAPSLEYLERAFNASKYRTPSAAPAIEITLPSIHDPSLAPDGQHVLSAIVQYAPYAPDAGWDTLRDAFTRSIIDQIETHAPGLKDSIVATELLTPQDIETQFKVAGGHWHHGDLAFDQFYLVRPFPGAAQYATPVAGLYLCGASSHPGGGVMGLAGQHAARAVIHAST